MTPISPDRRPTNVRLVILFLTTMVAVLLYLHRICLGFVEVYVTEDLNLTTGEMGWVLSSFFLSYAIFQVPAGWLSDRYGARLMLSIYLAAWSLCTGFMGFAYGVFSLILWRLGCGLFQAGAYPTSAGLIRKWIPFQRRGMASGMVSIGGRIGGAFAPPLTAYLMIAFVPIGTPSTLTPDDILPNQRDRFALALHAPETYFLEGAKKSAAPEKPEDADKRATQNEVLQRLATRLPPETTAFLKSIRVFGVGDELSDAELRKILDPLNQVLAEPDLFQGIDLTNLRLPRGARVLFEEESENVDSDRVERRNRLVLEATLPDVIRKIYGAGWRPVMWLYGAAGVLVAVLFWWAFRDSPRQHPGVNQAEIELIEGDAPAAASSISSSATPSSFPWKAILTNRSLWLVSSVQFLTNLGWVFLITWFPRYLAEEHRVPVEERSWMTLMPLFVGIGGMFLGGWLTDFTTFRFGTRLGRMLPLCGSRFLAGFAFLACLLLNAPWPVTFAMVLVAIATDLGTPSVWAYTLDIGGKNTGAVLGWGNMWGNLGAFVSPPLLEAVRSGYGYDAVFIVCAAAFILSGFLSLGMDATQPLTPETTDRH